MRKQKADPAYNARMASLYREVVLKEKPVVAENGFIPLGALGNRMALPLRRRSRKWQSQWRGTSSQLLAVYEKGRRKAAFRFLDGFVLPHFSRSLREQVPSG